ncbi:MAG: DUF3048 domain-containing protein [Tissierellia bacterium]|nr:DUF3048 domain-containing protein [Tissierellia bacterium]
MKKIIILMILFLLTACTRQETRLIEKEILEEAEETEKVEEAEKTVEVKKEGVPSPLSGIYVSENRVNRRPVAIMFDNHPSARWQSGLSQAEIVYEFLVEAPYTRYMGIYLINEPELIGPIRSSRPYFVTTLLEYDPIYIRVGGSPQAKKDIIQLKIADIDGLSSSNKVFWKNRNVRKKPPHNTYTSMEVIRKTQEDRKYKLLGEYEGFKFHEEDEDIVGDIANEIIINYFKNNITKYIYNSEEKLYYRQKDGKEHIDEFDKSPIVAKNIIIQEANTKIIDSEGRLAIDLIGEGKGKYITNGKAIDINWSKKSRSSKTIFSNKNGEEIVLNPGITWIQVVKTNPDIEIN